METIHILKVPVDIIVIYFDEDLILGQGVTQIQQEISHHKF